jgi:hypothetical protein
MLLSRFPLYGLGLPCCCLVFYLRPEAPHSAADRFKTVGMLQAPWRRRFPPSKASAQRCYVPAVAQVAGELAVWSASVDLRVS